MKRNKQRIARDPKGGFAVRLPEEERALIATLPMQLITALAELESEGGEVRPNLRRLFPTAYPKDEQAEERYVEAVRGDLTAGHREALELLTRTANEPYLTEEELDAWLAAINNLRLVLGTSLEVTEEPMKVEPDDPRFSEWVCYGYLSFLQEEIVEALSGLLPKPGDRDDEPLIDDPWGEPLGGLRWDGTPVPESQ